MKAKNPGLNPMIDNYISGFDGETRKRLEELRRIIRENAPEAEEVMSYQMPTYRLNGNLVHFAAYPRHIGFYPTPSAIEEFKPRLVPYKSSKGAVQFPVDKALPAGLIKDIVKFRVYENLKRNKM